MTYFEMKLADPDVFAHQGYRLSQTKTQTTASQLDPVKITFRSRRWRLRRALCLVAELLMTEHLINDYWPSRESSVVYDLL